MRRGGVLNGLVAILGTISQTGLGVRLETGARRDLLTHDDIGLEVEQMVDLALDGGLGEDARGADERRGGQPGVDGGSDLERTQNRRLGGRRREAQTRHAIGPRRRTRSGPRTASEVAESPVGDLNANAASGEP